MLSLIRRPKAQLAIHVENGPHYPGPTLGVRTTLTSEQIFSVRRGTIELICREKVLCAIYRLPWKQRTYQRK